MFFKKTPTILSWWFFLITSLAAPSIKLPSGLIMSTYAGKYILIVSSLSYCSNDTAVTLSLCLEYISDLALVFYCLKSSTTKLTVL